MGIIVYWHWIVAGIALMLLELFIPSFFALLFGAGAVVVGILLLLMPGLSVSTQVLLWTIISSTLTWLWFKYLKPNALKDDSPEIKLETLAGETGQVLTPPCDGREGRLRFPSPILGVEEWEFKSDDDLAIGDRVRVVNTSGKTLIVEKQNS